MDKNAELVNELADRLHRKHVELTGNRPLTDEHWEDVKIANQGSAPERDWQVIAAEALAFMGSGCAHGGELRVKYDGGRLPVLCEKCRLILGHLPEMPSEMERLASLPREPSVDPHRYVYVITKAGRELEPMSLGELEAWLRTQVAWGDAVPFDNIQVDRFIGGTGRRNVSLAVGGGRERAAYGHHVGEDWRYPTWVALQVDGREIAKVREPE